MAIETARNGDVELAYEVLGSADDEPLLLVMGLGGQMLSWPDGFCRLLIERGFHIARFDNRDSGLSTHFTRAGAPSQFKMLFKPGSQAAYRLEDMADDAAAVLDALAWHSAHIVGASQGGMIGQTLALRHPDRVRTLTCISSAPAPRVGQPKPRDLLKVIRVANPKRVKSAEDLGQYLVDMQQIAGSPAYPADENELRERGRELYERGGLDRDAVQRQTAALAASGDRRTRLAGISVPVLVLHGEEDRLIRVEAGRATAAAIPGARLVTYPGMGHDLPRELWSRIVDEIVSLSDGSGPAPRDQTT